MSAPAGRPWGWIAGLLAASVIIVIGIWRGVGPETLLWRALVAGVVCGIVARVARAVLIRMSEVG